MNKFSKLLIIAITYILLSLNVYAMGAGIQTSAILSNNGANADITGTVRLMRIPVTFGFGFEAGVIDEKFNLGFSGYADYLILDLQLYNTLNFFAGTGFGTHFITNQEWNWEEIIGIRTLAGLSYLLYDNYIELYFQAVIEPGVSVPLNFSKKPHFNLFYPLETGFRVHF